MNLESISRSALATLLLGVVTLLGSGCVTNIAGRSTFNAIPDSALSEMGAQSFAEMKAQEPISRNANYTGMLNRVGGRIATVSSAQIPNANWEFTVFAKEEINAFALPGGKVGAYEGLFDKGIVRSEDELAIVVGHEIAHVGLNHGGERMTQQLGVATVGTLLGIYMDTKDTKNKEAFLVAFGVGAQLGLLKYSRDHENEADELGLVYAARAGYDPRVAIGLWQRMDKLAGGGAPVEWLSTHPSSETRITRLNALMPKAVLEYEKTTGKPLKWPM